MASAPPVPPTSGLALTSTPEALARVPRAAAFRYDVLPLAVAGGVLTVAVPDAADDELLDRLRGMTRLKVRALPAGRERLREAIRTAYGEGLAPPSGDDAPAIKRVDLLLARAIAAHASDVHVEPAADGARVRLRIDGVLRETDPIASELSAASISRLKLLAGLDIAERRVPQDGRCSIPFDGRLIDARVSSVPAIGGEKLVVRLLDHFGAAPRLHGLGMPDEMRSRYREAATAPFGFVVASGPTGSGKTTTLYASLGELDVGRLNVCSVEDPVEIRVPGVTQVQVHARAGVTFAAALRAFMRQDPDVLMVGEMRDQETAAVAASAALSGRLVFTTLHANDALRSIERLLELGVPRHALAAALAGIVAQRLVRLLCERCRTGEPIPPSIRNAHRLAQTRWYVARGCRACDGTGYLGRTGVFELLLFDDTLRDAVGSGASSGELVRQASRTGYRPMREDGLGKVLRGLTSFAELQRVVGGLPPP